MTDCVIDRLVESVNKGTCSEISLEPRGVDRFLVHTGFTFQDGDELHIVLKKKDGRWIITDDAHTLMWLSCEDPCLPETCRTLLDTTLSSNNVSFDDGRIYIDCTDRDPEQCLMSMIQAILQTVDVLNRFLQECRLRTFESRTDRFLNRVVCFTCLPASATPGLPAVAFVTSIFEASSLSFSVLGLAIETGLTLP